MTSLPIVPPTARAGTALKTAAPPPGAAGGDFAALLTSTSARTASAEGPKTRQQDTPRRDAAAPRSDDAPKADRADDAQAAPTTKADNQAPVADATADQQKPAADQAPQPPATPAPVLPADPAAAAAQAAAQAALVQQQGQPAAPTAATPGAPGQPATPKDGVPIDPKALLQAADAQAPAGTDAAAADGAQGKLQIPAELLNAKGGDGKAGDHGKGAKDGQGKHALPPAPTLPPTADSAATPAPAATPSTAPTLQAAAADTTAVPQAPAPVAQAQPAATPQNLVPTAAGAGMGGAALTRGSVVQAVEHVQDLVRIATTRGGNARATLQLKPEALGQVDVHLRTTRDGLVATIAAHDQAGLDALQQAGGDLRRMLADRGVDLHSLDLQLGAGSDGFSNQGDARQASSGRSGGGATYDLDGDEDVTAEDLTISTTPLTATSTLVDVTA